MNNHWSTTAWEKINPVYNKIKALPFITALMEGSLTQQQFTHYIVQDAIYLSEYSKIITGIAAKLFTLEHRNIFLKLATDTIFAEQELHKTFKNAFAVKEKQEATPVCLLYTSYLHKQLAMEAIEVAVAAIVPCFVVYKKIGDFILQNQSAPDNPYQKWIDTYADEAFAEAVKQVESISNALAANAGSETRDKMLVAYTTSTKMEWMFWNSAYQLDSWPL